MSKTDDIKKYYETYKITQECMTETLKNEMTNITKGANGAFYYEKSKPIDIPFSNKITEKNKYHNNIYIDNGINS